MNLMRVRPTSDFLDTRAWVNRFFRDFDDTVSRFQGDSPRTFNGGSWSPAVDVVENEQEIVFNAELPGFEKNEINISVNDGRLTISGERSFEEKTGDNYHQVERWYGNFYRSFLLPTTVENDKISANLKNGVLTVRLPKKAEAQSRQIPVSV